MSSATQPTTSSKAASAIAVGAGKRDDRWIEEIKKFNFVSAMIPQLSSDRLEKAKLREAEKKKKLEISTLNPPPQKVYAKGEPRPPEPALESIKKDTPPPRERPPQAYKATIPKANSYQVRMAEWRAKRLRSTMQDNPTS